MKLSPENLGIRYKRDGGGGNGKKVIRRGEQGRGGKAERAAARTQIRKQEQGDRRRGKDYN